MCPTCQLLPLNKTKIETRELLIRAVWLVLLGTQLPFLQGCSTPREHKWLFYDLLNVDDVQYQGYKATTGAEEETATDGPVRRSIKNLKAAPANITSLDKPTVNEDDQLHIVFFGLRENLNPKNSLCKFAETPYSQPHDGKMVPPYPGKPKDKAAILQGRRDADAKVRAGKALVEKKRTDRVNAAKKVEELEKKKSSAAELNPAREALQKAEDELWDAEQELVDARLIASEAQEKTQPAAFICDIDVREKGGTKIVHSLVHIQMDKTEKVLFTDTVLVHDLYRFRVLAGPVFSTLHPKVYSLKANSSGQNEVTASHANTSPANFALMLKTYLWAKRDVLNPPSLFSSRWYEMINPVIGINLFDKPLDNLYLGLSLELAGGFDLVVGAHWAKTQQLTGGFYEGQTTTQSNVATKERFSNGWFVGVTADIGIITTWLSNVGSGLVGAIKTTP